MTFGVLLALILAAILVAVLPRWSWTRGWSYRPAIVYAILLAATVILIALQVV